ncbi:MAG: OmpA family protein, partial [Elusimicrobiaceae bacterium]|nr:OmpA family protein [Elusimicrobiaceae bacterium]
NFKYNSDAMDAKSTETVNKVAEALKKYPNAKVRVAGYTDSLGNANYNMDLSERRAYAVAQQLVKDGVPAANVSYIGYGAANPIATNKTAEGRYQNRRVELEVTNK